MAEPAYEVFWPLGRSAYKTLPLAPRDNDLSGKTVCELREWLFRGDEIFPIVGELLSQRFPGIKFVDYTVFGFRRVGTAKQKRLGGMQCKQKEVLQ